ncbi:HdaA/DnaA family protein [Aestuariibius insulae]|uniref:HdaA/DnaA family protein n=1 Tax=Aestuariibius insulae TaxID=2058287 RepID=UPI00345F0D62
MPRQLSFPLPDQTARHASDFFVSPANTIAHRAVMNPASWPDGRLALIGPAGSGKSHLAQAIAVPGDTLLLSAADLERDGAALPEAELIILDDLGDPLSAAAEERLFHIYNHLGSGTGKLLLIARTPPSQWPIALPDLVSRVKSVTPVQIEDPDDALLRALLTKLFRDRQLNPPPQVIERLGARIERSFAAAQTIVDRVDKEALAQGREMTWPFVRTLLEDEGPEA